MGVGVSQQQTPDRLRPPGFTPGAQTINPNGRRKAATHRQTHATFSYPRDSRRREFKHTSLICEGNDQKLTRAKIIKAFPNQEGQHTFCRRHRDEIKRVLNRTNDLRQSMLIGCCVSRGTWHTAACREEAHNMAQTGEAAEETCRRREKSTPSSFLLSSLFCSRSREAASLTPKTQSYILQKAVRLGRRNQTRLSTER